MWYNDNKVVGVFELTMERQPYPGRDETREEKHPGHQKSCFCSLLWVGFLSSLCHSVPVTAPRQSRLKAQPMRTDSH